MVNATSERSDVRLTRLLGEACPAVSRIGRMFDLMRITEEEIEEAKRRWPRRKKALHAAFGILRRGELLTYSDAVYRSHCRELLGRVMRREDVRLATDAELLVMFSRTSLIAPLASQFAFAMSVVFARVMPDADMGRYQTGHEAWAGGTEEILAAARRCLACDRAP